MLIFVLYNRWSDFRLRKFMLSRFSFISYSKRLTITNGLFFFTGVDTAYDFLAESTAAPWIDYTGQENRIKFCNRKQNYTFPKVFDLLNPNLFNKTVSACQVFEIF